MGAPSALSPGVGGHYQRGNGALAVGQDGLAAGGSMVGIDVGQAAGGSVLHPVDDDSHAQDVPVELEGFVQVTDADSDVGNAGSVHCHSVASCAMWGMDGTDDWWDARAGVGRWLSRKAVSPAPAE